MVFVYPDDRRINYIKRIIAMPGDTVEIKNDVVYINDEPLIHDKEIKKIQSAQGQITGQIVREINKDKSYTIMLSESGANPSSFSRITIPHGCCFVLGDNRSNSKDSRHFGPIPLADVKGRVDYIYYPVSRFGQYRD